MRSRADLASIWKHCTRNRALLEHSEQAGCFHCGAMFASTEIVEWIDEPPPAMSGTVIPEGVTALCPRCGMDAVLPGAQVSLTPELLAEMADHYFGSHFKPARSAPPAG